MKKMDQAVYGMGVPNIHELDHILCVDGANNWLLTCIHQNHQHLYKVLEHTGEVILEWSGCFPWTCCVAYSTPLDIIVAIEYDKTSGEIKLVSYPDWRERVEVNDPRVGAFPTSVAGIMMHPDKYAMVTTPSKPHVVLCTAELSIQLWSLVSKVSPVYLGECLHPSFTCFHQQDKLSMSLLEPSYLSMRSQDIIIVWDLERSALLSHNLSTGLKSGNSFEDTTDMTRVYNHLSHIISPSPIELSHCGINLSNTQRNLLKLGERTSSNRMINTLGSFRRISVFGDPIIDVLSLPCGHFAVCSKYKCYVYTLKDELILTFAWKSPLVATTLDNQPSISSHNKFLLSGTLLGIELWLLEEKSEEAGLTWNARHVCTTPHQLNPHEQIIFKLSSDFLWLQRRSCRHKNLALLNTLDIRTQEPSKHYPFSLLGIPLSSLFPFGNIVKQNITPESLINVGDSELIEYLSRHMDILLQLSDLPRDRTSVRDESRINSMFESLLKDDPQTYTNTSVAIALLQSRPQVYGRVLVQLYYQKVLCISDAILLIHESDKPFMEVAMVAFLSEVVSCVDEIKRVEINNYLIKLVHRWSLDTSQYERYLAKSNHTEINWVERIRQHCQRRYPNLSEVVVPYLTHIVYSIGYEVKHVQWSAVSKEMVSVKDTNMLYCNLLAIYMMAAKVCDSEPMDTIIHHILTSDFPSELTKSLLFDYGVWLTMKGNLLVSQEGLKRYLTCLMSCTLNSPSNISTVSDVYRHVLGEFRQVLDWDTFVSCIP